MYRVHTNTINTDRLICFWVWVSREPVIYCFCITQKTIVLAAATARVTSILSPRNQQKLKPTSIDHLFLPWNFWWTKSDLLVWPGLLIWSTSIISTSPSCFWCRTTVSSWQTTVSWGGPSALCSEPEEVWLSRVKSSFFLFFLLFGSVIMTISESIHQPHQSMKTWKTSKAGALLLLLLVGVVRAAAGGRLY